MDEGRRDMTMRDKIAQVLCETPTVHYGKQADAIIAALPDYDAQQARIAELEAALRRVLPYVSTSREDAERACMERQDSPIADAVSLAHAALKGISL
jgi:hypothetical protein